MVRDLVDIFKYINTVMNISLKYRPCGKESTEVRKTQNKGKESENSYRKLKSSWWTGTRTCTQKQNRISEHGSLP